MINIDSIIENIYLDVNLSNESRFIFIPGYNNESMYKVNSRYRSSGVNYSPYKITREFYNRLFNSLILIPNINEIADKDDLLIENNNTFAVAFAPVRIKNLLFNGDFTPEGLLAFRARKHFGNLKFRYKVEEQLSKFLHKTVFKNVEYFINEEYNIDNLDDKFKEIFLKQNSFYWSDL